MGMRLRLREVASAAGCALWVGLAGGPEIAWGVVLPMVLVLGGLSRRTTWPVLAMLSVMGAQLAGALHGLSVENTALLPAELIAAYSVGRFTVRRVTWLVPIAVTVMVWALDDFYLLRLVFGLVVMSLAWGLGRIVRVRTLAAHEAVAAEERARSLDPGAVSAQVVADERARVTTDAVHVVRDAVTDMVSHAQASIDGRGAVDRDQLERIHERGLAAVDELRLLLGLLRGAEPQHAPDRQGGEGPPRPARPPRPRPPRPRRPARAYAGDVAVGVGLAVLTVLVPEVERGTVATVAAGVLCLLIALRRVHPTGSAVAAAAAVAVHVVAEPTQRLGIFTLVAAASLIWWAVTTGTRVAWLAVGALTVLSTAVTARMDLMLAPMILAVHVFPALAATAWRASDREVVRAGLAEAGLRAVLDDRVADAVRAERRRLARELHDVTSHAVGVMLLQAQAAQSLLDSRPESAISALRVIESTGHQALAELRLLEQVVRPGDGDRGSDRDSDRDGDGDGVTLADRLATLMARVEQTGVHVIPRIEGLPAGTGTAEVAVAVHRVVQESLTNVARHAPGSTVRVDVRTDDRHVHLRVADDGPGPRATRATAGSGLGLLGLGERVRSLGGELWAGPEPGGGFVVEARVPLPTRRPSPARAVAG